MKNNKRIVALVLAIAFVLLSFDLVKVNSFAEAKTKVITTTQECSIWTRPNTSDEYRQKKIPAGHKVTIYTDIIPSEKKDGKTFYQTQKGAYILCKYCDGNEISANRTNPQNVVNFFDTTPAPFDYTGLSKHSLYVKMLFMANKSKYVSPSKIYSTDDLGSEGTSILILFMAWAQTNLKYPKTLKLDSITITPITYVIPNNPELNNTYYSVMYALQKQSGEMSQYKYAVDVNYRASNSLGYLVKGSVSFFCNGDSSDIKYTYPESCTESESVYAQLAYYNIYASGLPCYRWSSK